MLFVQDFTTLLTALVPKLDRLGSRLSVLEESSIRPVADHVFWELWCCLAYSCSAFNTASVVIAEPWPTLGDTLFTSLRTALMSVMTWLESVSHTKAWQLMKVQHGVSARNAGKLLILDPSLRIFRHIAEANLDAMIHLSILLPSGFVPLLCSLLFQ